VTGEKFFGFYWTLPVPWKGFRKLPADIDAAAQKSRTIRYQRDFVRRWVKEVGGNLIGERAFLEVQPDRASAHVTPEIDRVIRKCQTESATIVLVDFPQAFGWRRHGPLWDRLHQPSVQSQALYPEPMFRDGEEFDPVEHFRTWRRIEAARIESKAARAQHLAELINELKQDDLTLKEVAEALNQRGATTPTGKLWTADNLRKFMKSL
jgi:hypothetical protein